MSFVGKEVELEGGRPSQVAFYVVKNDKEEILLGTDALSGLGVRLSRKNIDNGTKIKLYRKRVITLDPEALARVLKVAYDTYVEWTVFACSASEIRKNATIENHSFDGADDTVVRAVKERIREESRRNRSTKVGPIKFAAPETARPLEKDGEGIGIRTRVVVIFIQ
ncbi:hypothetical protein ANCDUO_26230, partial [Ancylostoma duodenale]